MKNTSRINGHGEVARCVEKSLHDYFRKLDGEPVTGIYAMVICNVEKSVFETVMHHAKGNQTHAAEILGVNRNTLRTKLKHYGIK